MSIPEPVLDDLRFQQIVNEARLRIHRYCPEWTDYNLSDPGITLIELFAWMTEMITFRLNQVPAKNHIRFLNMLGEELAPPKAAKTALTFYLSVPLPIDAEDPQAVTVHIPSGEEVATLRAGDAPEVIFTADKNANENGVDTGYTVSAPTLVFLQRPAEPLRNYWDAERQRVYPVMPAFSADPKGPDEGDAFYMGFDSKHDVRGYILKLNFQCDDAKGSGIAHEDPPWRWQCWATNALGQPDWVEVKPSQHPREKDTTGGLNNPSGALVLYLPREALPGKPDGVYNREAYWVRCTYKRASKTQKGYDTSPEILGVRAEVMGITLPATHAQTTHNEFLGKSNGEPGQAFALQRQPVLRVGVVHEIERDARNNVISQKRWQCVKDFAKSDLHARHFCLDAHTGEIAFGPNVPQHDDAPKQFGRVPASGCDLVLSEYQYGGGMTGNVPAGSLQELRRSLSYVDRVTNLVPATGGADEEGIAEATLRLRKHMWAKRAVSASDFEVLAQEADSRVARAYFVPPSADEVPRGVADLRIVPCQSPTDYAISPSRLSLSDDLQRNVRTYLDARRLLTTMLDVHAPGYVGVQIKAAVKPLYGRKPAAVQADVARALHAFLCPINVLPDCVIHAEDDFNLSPLDKVLRQFLAPLGEDDSLAFRWQGWPFGRSLLLADVQNLILQVPGVADVRDLSWHTIRFSLTQPPGTAQGDALTQLDAPRLELARHELLCSLDGALDHVITEAK